MYPADTSHNRNRTPLQKDFRAPLLGRISFDWRHKFGRIPEMPSHRLFLSYIERGFEKSIAGVINQLDKEWKRSCATIAKDGIIAPHIWHISPRLFSSPSLSHASSPEELPCVDGSVSSDPRPASSGRSI